MCVKISMVRMFVCEGASICMYMCMYVRVNEITTPCVRKDCYGENVRMSGSERMYVVCMRELLQE